MYALAYRFVVVFYISSMEYDKRMKAGPVIFHKDGEMTVSLAGASDIGLDEWIQQMIIRDTVAVELHLTSENFLQGSHNGIVDCIV